MTYSVVERESFIRRYEEGPALLRRAWDEVPEEARQWRPAEGEWSAHEVVVHCADSEAYAAVRIRLLLAEPEPLIVGYDEGAWARRFDYQAHPVDLAFALIESARAHTASLLWRLPEEAWGRVGRHTQSGAYSTEDWLRIYAEHLEVHRAQIHRNIKAWGERR